MIVDTSALVAIARQEAEWETMSRAILASRALIPAFALVEYRRVMARAGNEPDPDAEALIAAYLRRGFRIEPFTAEDGEAACAANPLYGSGNGRGGRLNLLDLMVYGMARRLGLPILCTGRDFAATGISIHPASRNW